MTNNQQNQEITKLSNEYDLILAANLDWSIFAEIYKDHIKDSDHIRFYLENWQYVTFTIPEKFNSITYGLRNKFTKDSKQSHLVHFLKSESNKHILSSATEEINDKLSNSNTSRDEFMKVIFDEKFYSSKYNIESENAFDHYIKQGIYKGYSPCLFIDYDYLKFHLPNQSANENIILEWLNSFETNFLPCSIAADVFKKISNQQKNKFSLKEIARISRLISLIGFGSQNQAKYFLAIFCSNFFSTDYKQINILDAIEFWFQNGIDQQFSILFDSQKYAQEIGLTFESDFDAFKHWANFYNKTKIIPSYLFSEIGYKKLNPDLTEDIDFFDHYLIHGQFEGRPCTTLLDRMGASEDTPLLNSWVFNDLSYDYLESAFKNFISNHFNFKKSDQNVEIIHLKCLIIEIINSIDINSNDALVLINMLNINILSDVKIQTLTDLNSALRNWFLNGAYEDFSFFVDKKYISNISDEPHVSSLSAFETWCKKFEKLSVSPSRLFDPSFYLYKYPELKECKEGPFFHFFNFGQYEGRMPNILIDPIFIKSNYFSQLPSSGMPVYFEAINSQKYFKPSPGICFLSQNLANQNDSTNPNKLPINLYSDILDYLKETQSFDFSPESEILKSISDICEIEPSIKLNNPDLIFSLMPFNMDIYPFIDGVKKMVGTTDIIIFRDHISFGGADEVLKSLIKALCKTNYTFKILASDGVDKNFAKNSNISPNNIIDMHANLYPANELCIDLFYDLIIGSKAKYIFNINSKLCWQVTKAYGKILSRHLKIKAFLFCDDKDELGNIDGYPSRFFMDTFDYVSQFFIDSFYLKEKLQQKFIDSDVLGSKLQITSTPINKTISNAYPSFEKNNFNKIAWAGRFDRQKRPDLLKAIAERLPNFEFYVWGQRLLDNNDYQLKSVANIKLLGLFADIKDIKDINPNIFLFTSEWEGVPTMLLKIHEISIPIIASNVGGVSEIAPEISLVQNIDDVEAYVKKIEFFRSNYDYVVKEHSIFRDKLYSDRSVENFEKIVTGGL